MIKIVEGGKDPITIKIGRCTCLSCECWCSINEAHVDDACARWSLHWTVKDYGW
ncbi:hypothetical protein NLD30_11310 [SCandidatus Aminicenantes bacterium Aminicenantia_JdfR_composite]|jgi:hypothetical protein|nr:hypothetical protein [SCandidatus Aminicenantes bacterium Aminicenantia_JdfR_composite]MCP2598786.1 hypothetical protein [Candidatus Aminicenantes bacterium AC-335-L06]